MQTADNPFRIALSNDRVARTLEHLLGLNTLAKYYDARPEQFKRQWTGDESLNIAQDFLRYTVASIGAKVDASHLSALQQIPKEGPLVCVSNHPLGGLDGVVLTELLLSVRPDTLVLTNELLTSIPELRPVFVGVDILSKDARQHNTQGLRRVFKHLGHGGALLLFPAGEVSAVRPLRWQIADSRWDPLVGKLIKKYQADCLPFFFHGRNSFLFYVLGLIHPALRTLLLPRQLVNKRGKTLSIRVGDVLHAESIASLGDAQAITHFLRAVTYRLAQG